MKKFIFAVSILMISGGLHSPAFAAKCTGSTTATVVCLAIQQTEANLVEAKKLGANWRAKYNQFKLQCVKQIGGAGSKESDIGGAARLDFAECVRDKIKAALK